MLRDVVTEKKNPSFNNCQKFYPSLHGFWQHFHRCPSTLLYRNSQCLLYDIFFLFILYDIFLLVLLSCSSSPSLTKYFTSFPSPPLKYFPSQNVLLFSLLHFSLPLTKYFPSPNNFPLFILLWPNIYILPVLSYHFFAS